MADVFEFEISPTMCVIFESGTITVQGEDGDGYAVEASRDMTVQEHSELLTHLQAWNYPTPLQVRPVALCGVVSNHVNSLHQLEINYVKV